MGDTADNSNFNYPDLTDEELKELLEELPQFIKELEELLSKK
ncbi:hypothetical protein [Sporomusa acidovorans]|uniref:Uncharacterized protein n=1 Tax=Sporomusa acidovorans (strain ATCC 49682 / DSM 3132 / Mol) TaxID=1123286 RepID=A0ABZ3J3X5_SPOA4|nr:hypothetical protein [Sporomusa acidovorans]OZC20270.1 hypothetical protein SPACI_26680 [Sporomusa acidovorans DSM 3132]SDD39879.1 hypothetical protein SAMN04488499_1001117 [Sporomusa acidovorans]